MMKLNIGYKKSSLIILIVPFCIKVSNQSIIAENLYCLVYVGVFLLSIP